MKTIIFLLTFIWVAVLNYEVIKLIDKDEVLLNKISALEKEVTKMKEVAVYGASDSIYHKLINDYRENKGLSRLSNNSGLCELAQKRLEQLSAGDWSHNGFNAMANDGSLFDYCPKCYNIGENLARDFTNENGAMTAWDNSPSHHANLNDASYNVGCVVRGGVYVVSIFGASR